jgi:SAM-dependent methyltransferase
VLSRFWRRLQYVRKTGLRRRLRDIALKVGADGQFALREDLARRYLTGKGIEIGAGYWPLRLPPGVGVRYVDYVSRERLVEESAGWAAEAHLDPESIPRVDVIDDVERLSTFADGAEDFVIANHVLEHAEDPIGALRNLLRVVRADGIVFLTLPDARHSWDARRPRTTIEHLLRDHKEGPMWSRRAHYEEWARYIEGVAEDQIAARADEFAGDQAKHHFHVWDLADFLALIRALDLPCELELAQANKLEFAVILRKI